MKIILKALRIVITVLLCVLILANIWLLAARFIFHEDLPKLFGYSQAIVVSGSMEPTFSAGDMIIFREEEGCGVGDVVIFRQDGVFVTHRIVAETEGGFITRGDANNTEDSETLDPTQIEGVLTAIVPGVGGVLSFLRTPLGILILILTGILLIEGPNIATALKKGKREDKR